MCTRFQKHLLISGIDSAVPIHRRRSAALRTVLRTLFAVFVVLGAQGAAMAAAAIGITSLPAYGAGGVLRGLVSGVDTSQFRVATFLYVPGLGWYRKPLDSMPTVPIAADGTWSADVDTSGAAGLDRVATIYGAWLVPNGYVVPPSPAGNYRVPAELGAFPHDIKERTGKVVQFANRLWQVKEASLPVGPGPNVFSTQPSDVYVDSAGLHLTLRRRDTTWWSTEVTMLGERLGYGIYWYQTSTRVDTLDPNVTFAGFLFDDYGDEVSPDGSRNREIDVAEDSKWGATVALNTQNSKQPFDYRPANRHRFNLPNLTADTALTRIMIWRPDSIRFVTVRGFYIPDSYPASAVVDEYVYTHDPSAGQYVPVPGRERFHFNLWLNKLANPTAPIDGQPVEVVIRDFRFAPLAGPAPNYQGMWWSPPEAGWGINVTHQADIAFASWFTYGLDGKPLWLTMTAQRQDDGSFTGAIDGTTGPPFSAVPFDSTQVGHATVGAGRLAFTDATHGTFSYTVNGVTQSKPLTRFVFGQPVPTCIYPAPVAAALATNYTDMWSNAAEAGWGINLTHQSNVLFASWFTYGANNQPLWLTATLTPTGPRIFAGALDSTTGPPFNAVPFDPGMVMHQPVGVATITFADAANASFTYTYAGVTQTKALTRFVFRLPGTVCG